MTAVFDTRVGSQSKKLVLLALADNANENGECWPSLAVVAKKAELDPRTISRIIQFFEKKQWVTISRKAGEPNHYHFNLAKFTSDTTMSGDTPDTIMSGLTNDHPRHELVLGVQTPACLGSHDMAMSSKPSLNHQLTISTPLPPSGGKEVELRDRAVGLVKKFQEQFKHYVRVRDGKALEKEISAARSLLAVIDEPEVLELAGRALGDRFPVNRLRASTLTQMAKNLAELRALFPESARAAAAPLVRGGNKTPEEIWQDWDEYVAWAEREGKEVDEALKPEIPRPVPEL